MSESRRDPDKARSAAADPQRPGQECAAEPGAWRPVVNRQRCEGKRECLAVCPYNVFEVRRMDEAEYRALPPLARFKSFVHGKQSAYTPRESACRACGLCVVACPEHAIELVRVAPR